MIRVFRRIPAGFLSLSLSARARARNSREKIFTPKDALKGWNKHSIYLIQVHLMKHTFNMLSTI